MPVSMPSPPIESVTALNQALAAENYSTRAYLATAEHPSQWVHQKLYLVFVQDLAVGKPVIECAREAGWRYLLPQAFGVAVSAEIRIDAEGRHLLGHFAQGPQTTQTLEFTHRIVDDPQFAAEDYTLQLLFVPGL